MRCQTAQRWLSLWLDNLLSEKEQRALESHLQDCVACRQLWQQWERAREALRSYPTITPSPDFDRRLLAQLKTTPLSAPPMLSHWLMHPAFRPALAALGGAVVALLPLLLLVRSSPTAPPPSYWLQHRLGQEIAQLLGLTVGREPPCSKELPPSSSQLPPPSAPL